MERVNLKDNIFIDGFDSELSAVSTGGSMWFGKNMELLLYAGKTSEIPEDVAEECAEWDYVYMDIVRWTNYKTLSHDDNLNTAKQSIQSACQEEYCIIYKEE